MTERKYPILSLVNTALAIIGVVATVFSCLIAFIVLVNPTMAQRVIIEFYNPITPTPKVIVITQPAPTLPPLPTYTPYPTYALPPTYTPFPQPSLIPTFSLLLPFSDNFDNGVDSNWNITSGVWRTIDGRLVADPSNKPSEIIVGDENWENYVIELDVFSNSAAGFPIGVIVRSMNGKSLIFRTDCCNTDWILIDRESQQSIAHINQGGLDFTLSGFVKNRIRVEVIGQMFTGYIDGKQFLQVTDSTNPTGAVGIMSQTPHGNSLLFDNFVVTVP